MPAALIASAGATPAMPQPESSPLAVALAIWVAHLLVPPGPIADSPVMQLWNVSAPVPASRLKWMMLASPPATV